MKFNDETKEVKEFTGGNYFGFGVHKVQIMLIELGQTDQGKEYIEVTVCDPENPDITDTARTWFTSDKAANFSFNVWRKIYVHNAPEEHKEAAGNTIDEVPGTDELVEKLTEKLIGGECWFTKYPDPERTYLDQNNVTRKSINKNIYGYAPKLRTDLMPKEDETAAAGDSAVNKTFPGATKAEGGIPADW